MTKKKLSAMSLPLSIWGLGFVTLLMNVSSSIVNSTSPLYLTQVLGVTTLHLGLLEGTLEATSWFTRVFSGMLSDMMHKRKPILMVAYGVVACARPLLPIAHGIGLVTFSRMMERLGNGLQASPREALIGDWAPKGMKGASYGLRHALGLFGSFAGTIIAVYVMCRTQCDYRMLFWGSAIPPLLGMLVLYFVVRDLPAKKSDSKQKTFMESCKQIKHLPRPYWVVVGIGAIFMMSNYGIAYVILRASAQGLDDSFAPIVMALQNFCAMVAYPIGRLSDRVDRRILLAIGFCMTIAANLFLLLDGVACVLISACLWGVQLGMTQSLLLTKIADTAPSGVRGTGFGMYYVTIGASLFIANSLTGWLSHHTTATHAFLCSAAIAAVALCCIPFMKPSAKVSA